MEHSSAIVENSEDYLKVCILILNEVLKEIPICDSYRNFCNLVGRNFMIYSDFEFWFYQLHRFCRGYFYDYDLSADLVPVTIMDMPMEMIQEITRNLDLVELTHLQAMNESFQHMVDSIVLLDSYIDHLKNVTLILNEVLGKKPIFYSYLNFCKLVGENTINYPDFEFLYYRLYRLSRGELNDCDQIINPAPKTLMDMPVSLMYKIIGYLDTVERTYLRSMNRCLKDIADIRPPNFESDECFVKKGMEYLSPVLEMPNLKVNHLSLYIMNGCTYLNDLLPIPFHAKTMNPGELESIDFSNYDIGYTATREDVLEFYETEQFKQANRVESNIYLYEIDLIKFSHLKTFKFRLNFRELVDFQMIRDMISSFENFESCELKSINNRDGFDMRTVAEDLGAEIPFGPLKTVTHRYQIPESNEYLEFKIEEEESYRLIKIAKVR
ncbi:hypothetical protein B9Z55_026927 [Caenorhabditis nigoni]|uniref:F-box domain-containing protein n=1 Tax=Caenorhabditis nigoni TaxID=1611254 RepID=A0A2G5SI26_9PELO|nr:hypothetical protein B9Z55_026927 [Caenorhabditis nigoni]